MRFPRFVVIGGLCAFLNNVWVIGLSHFGFGYVASSCLAFGPILLVGYALHSAVTFETHFSQHSFIRYALAMATNFPIWIAALYLFCDIFNVAVAIAAPAATVLIFIWNYASARWAILSAARRMRTNVQTDG
jgi:putative flippase GtrA